MYSARQAEWALSISTWLLASGHGLPQPGRMEQSLLDSAIQSRETSTLCKVAGVAAIACAGAGGLIGACIVNDDAFMPL